MYARCKMHEFNPRTNLHSDSEQSWFIFNLRKITTNQYYESDSLKAGNSNMICEYMTLQDNKCIIITVHT
jgi:hypothetical protein